MSQNIISIKTKKHKSLGVLTLILIKLFLQAGPVLSLEQAADFIFEGDDDGQSVFKSKVTNIRSSFCLEPQTLRHRKRPQVFGSHQEAKE
jgi:hypothetical protein